MTAEPSCKMYRETVPDMVDPYVHSDTSLIQQLVDRDSLTPDTRLQAIADAPKCEHDMIDRHITHVKEAVTKWCEGAPELRDLLDALTEKSAI